MYLKTAPELFLGQIELKKWNEATNAKGFERLASLSIKKPGIVRNYLNSFKVITQAVGQITIQSGIALTSSGLCAVVEDPITLTVPDDGVTYFVQIAQSYSSLEKGTVSISNFGNLTGDGTCKFTECLRQGIDFPSTIIFPGSGNNNGRYTVISVADDNHAILQGYFQEEAGLSYAVAGTFTPGLPVPPENLFPFQYDSATISLVTTLPTNSNFFVLAAVQRSGAAITIQDLRSNYYCLSTEEERYLSLKNINSPYIGVEKIEYTPTRSSPGNQNLVTVGWGLRASSWTYSANSVTLTSVLGGKIKSITDIESASHFIGWRLYNHQGQFTKVVQSSIAGSALTLTLESFNPDTYVGAIWNSSSTYSRNTIVQQGGARYICILVTGTSTNQSPATNPEVWSVFTDPLYLTPDCDEIDFMFNVGRNMEGFEDYVQFDTTVTFPTAQGQGKVSLEAFSWLGVTSVYEVLVRYRTTGNSSQWFVIPSDNAIGANVGYLNEVGVRVPYTAVKDTGFIFLTQNPSAYANFKQNVDRGDLYGVTRRAFSDSEHFINLTVGVATVYQIFTGSDLTLSTGNIYINLDTVGTLPNNMFFLTFEQKVNLGSFYIIIKQGAESIDPGGTGTVLKTLTQFELTNYFTNGRGACQFVFDGTGAGWSVVNNPLVNLLPKGTILEWSINANDLNPGTSAPYSLFDLVDESTGLGYPTERFVGFALMDGRNGTLNKQGRVSVGFSFSDSTFNTIGAVGGEKTHLLTAAESGLPGHNHIYTQTSRGISSSSPSDGNNAISGGSTAFSIHTTQNTGMAGPGDASQAHNNLQPYIVSAFLQKII